MKSKGVIRPEIPERHHTRGDEFGCIEPQSDAFVEQVNDAVVDAQPDQRSQQKLGELRGHRRVLALEGPHAVEQIVAHHRTQESRTVGYVFVEAQFFLAQPGNPEIHSHTGGSDYSEFDKLEE